MADSVRASATFPVRKVAPMKTAVPPTTAPAMNSRVPSVSCLINDSASTGPVITESAIMEPVILEDCTVGMMDVSVETIGVSADTVGVSVETIGVSADTVGVSADIKDVL